MSRASLLAYLGRLALTQGSNETPPALNPTIHRTWSSPYLRSGKLVDEEAQPGRGVYLDTLRFECTRCGIPATSKYKKHRPSLYEVWSVICVVSFTCCIVLFVLDLIFSLYGMGTGVAECMVRTSAMSSQTNDEVRGTCRCSLPLRLTKFFTDAALSRFP
jgi:hypothetical protein